MLKQKYIRNHTKTKTLREKILDKLKNGKKMCAYDIARSLKEDYPRIVHICRSLEKRGKIKTVGFEEGQGPFQKRMYKVV